MFCSLLRNKLRTLLSNIKSNCNQKERAIVCDRVLYYIACYIFLNKKHRPRPT